MSFKHRDGNSPSSEEGNQDESWVIFMANAMNATHECIRDGIFFLKRSAGNAETSTAG